MSTMLKLAFPICILAIGCTAGSRDEEPPASNAAFFAYSPSNPAYTECSVDDGALDLLDDNQTSCACSANDRACVDQIISACSQFPRATCAPELGYRCTGQVQLPQNAGTCPPGWGESSAGTCVAQVPRICSNDVECPAGSYCDLASGGVCSFECRSVESCVPPGPSEGGTCCALPEICDCRGKCSVPNSETEVPLVRESVVLSTNTLYFSSVASADDRESAAQRVRVGVNNPLLSDYQDVRVVASRGMMVFCSEPAHGRQRPTEELLGEVLDSDYRQECVLSFAEDGPRTQSVWVLPANIESPVTSAGVVDFYIQGVNRRRAARISITVDDNDPGQSAAPEGWYSGRATLRGISVVEPETEQAIDAAGLMSPGLSIPVRAWLGETAGDLDVTVYDDTQTLSPYGKISVRYPGGLSNTAPPVLTGSPRWLSLESAMKTALNVEGLSGSTHSLPDFAASQFVWWERYEQDELEAIFPFGATDEQVVEPAMVWELTLHPDASNPSANGKARGVRTTHFTLSRPPPPMLA